MLLRQQTTEAPKLVTIDDLVASPRPIVLAHAGGEDQHPHSTPYAFTESVKAGVDMLDFDVQLSRDGVLVVQHDDTVDRTTNGTGNVAEMTYAELAQLDNAYWFTKDCTCVDQPAENYVLRGMRTGAVTPLPGYTPDDFAIPRFRDIVASPSDAAPQHRDQRQWSSGKCSGTSARRRTRGIRCSAARGGDLIRRLVVEAFHQMAPSVELSPGTNAATAWVLADTPLPLDMRILQLPPEFSGIEVLTPATIQKSHAAGYVIWVWPNDRARWENAEGYAELLAMGLDGLNINFPDHGVAAVVAAGA